MFLLLQSGSILELIRELLTLAETSELGNFTLPKSAFISRSQAFLTSAIEALESCIAYGSNSFVDKLISVHVPATFQEELTAQEKLAVCILLSLRRSKNVLYHTHYLPTNSILVYIFNRCKDFFTSQVLKGTICFQPELQIF